MRKKDNAANINISVKISLTEQHDLIKLAKAEHLSQSAYVRAIITDRINFEKQSGNTALTDDYEQPGGLFPQPPAAPATQTKEAPADSNPGNPETK